MLTDAQIAQVAYEANRAYAAVLGDHSFGPWEEAPEWQQATCIKGVQFHRTTPAASASASASASHDSWYAEKLATGWRYGPVKDPKNKEHPCMVPFEDLPIEQQRKDHLFKGIVQALL